MTDQRDDERVKAPEEAKPRAQEQGKPKAQEQAKPKAEEEAKPRAQEQAKPKAQEQAEPRAPEQAEPRAQEEVKPKARAGPAVALREMELDDLPAVYALGERLFTAERWPALYRTWDQYDVVSMFASDGEYCLVAEQAGRIVGFVLGTIIEKRKGPWTYGHLVWLGVDPEFAGRGIARRLVARLTELFIDGGARIMMVDTDAENARAIAFFKRAGFGDPVDHVHMTKNLTTLPEYRRRKLRESSGW